MAFVRASAWRRWQARVQSSPKRRVDLGYGEENDDGDDDTQVRWRVEDSHAGQNSTTELK
jgi:hypothetical protein